MNKKLWLERIYYHDPFSYIVMSVDFLGKIDIEEVKKAIETVLGQYRIFHYRIHQNELGECYYIEKEHDEKLAEIIYVEPQQRAKMVEKLLNTFLDIEKGETARFVLHRLENGIRMFMCVHHIIADGKSLLLILKDIIHICCRGEMDYEPAGTEKEFAYEEYFREIQLNDQMKHIVKLVNLKWSRKIYSHKEAKKLFYEMTERQGRKIKELCILSKDYDELIGQCKRRKITVTSYIVARILEEEKADGVRLPADLRREESDIGNYVGRIDILRKEIEQKEIGQGEIEQKEIEGREEIWQKAEKINKILKTKREEKGELMEEIKLLTELDPTLLDCIIYMQYQEEKSKLATQISKILRYKEKENLIVVSNLNKFKAETKKYIKASNLFFYPPAAIERTATVGIVSFDSKMTVTWQSFG